MPPVFPSDIQQMLRQASEGQILQKFTCKAFENPEWNEFVELWAPRIYTFIYHALGPYGKNPQSEILPLTEGFHSASVNASFDIESGQICLSTALQDKPGALLEKLTHETTHASLARFPEGDPFYEEGWVDYAVWVMAHAPCWEPYRTVMIESAANNIRDRRERALRTGNDYDRKRWAGGFYASIAFGPYIITMLRRRKEEKNYTW
jgi:hypothetical protein